MTTVTAFLERVISSPVDAARMLAWSALVFALLALVTKRRGAFAGALRAAHETRVTLSFWLLDAMLLGPPLGLLGQLLWALPDRYSLTVVPAVLWTTVGPVATLFAAVFIGDFVSYWRHRFEHTRWLWPSHAIHHSDTEMTWFTLSRFHPINRLVTVFVDNAALALLGFPVWALVANTLIRHYYGEFIHADVPWMYGRLAKIFVSPTMHRWHHARDVTGAGSNFATVFSVFDRAFGTYHVPGPCTVPLGVTDRIGRGALKQLTYPFTALVRDIRRTRRARDVAAQGFSTPSAGGAPAPVATPR